MKIIRGILRFIIPHRFGYGVMTCEEAAELLINNDGISKSRRLRLEIHVRLCECCVSYKKQLKFLSKKTQDLKSLESLNADPEKISFSKADIINKYSK